MMRRRRSNRTTAEVDTAVPAADVSTTAAEADPSFQKVKIEVVDKLSPTPAVAGGEERGRGSGDGEPIRICAATLQGRASGDTRIS